jgi:hypothetical protein
MVYFGAASNGLLKMRKAIVNFPTQIGTKLPLYEQMYDIINPNCPNPANIARSALFFFLSYQHRGQSFIGERFSFEVLLVLDDEVMKPVAPHASLWLSKPCPFYRMSNIELFQTQSSQFSRFVPCLSTFTIPLLFE